MFERFSDQARHMFFQANQKRLLRSGNTVTTADLVLSLLESEGIVSRLLVAAEAKPVTIKLEIERCLREGGFESDTCYFKIGKLGISSSVESVVKSAFTLSRALGHKYVGTEHLLLACLKSDSGGISRVLQMGGLTYERTFGVIQASAAAEAQSSGSAMNRWESARAQCEEVADFYTMPIRFFECLAADVGCPPHRAHDLFATLGRAEYQKQLLPIWRAAWIEVQRADEGPSV